MMKIERHVPMPAAKGNRKYPWNDLKVGESFFVPGKRCQQLAPVAAGFSKSKNGKGKKFATRQMDGGVRVWRIK